MLTKSTQQLAAPLFSICIPQYNRSAHLIAAIASFASQQPCQAVIAGQPFAGVELCVVDDCSTDGGSASVLVALQQSGLAFSWQQDGVKRQYDRCLRAAMQLARGRYLLPFGNDDGLAAADALAQLTELLAQHQWPEVAVCNFNEAGATVRRVTRTGIVGQGLTAAVKQFKQFGFVSGVVLARDDSVINESSCVDDSKMLQMYYGCRLLAAGGKLLAIESALVQKDLQIPGLQAEQFYNQERLNAWPIRTNVLNPAKLAMVVVQAIKPYASTQQAASSITQVLGQLYRATYPYWLITY